MAPTLNDVLITEDPVKNGAERVRTADPHVANVMLYQLSYRPMVLQRDPADDAADPLIY